MPARRRWTCACASPSSIGRSDHGATDQGPACPARARCGARGRAPVGRVFRVERLREAAAEIDGRCKVARLARLSNADALQGRLRAFAVTDARGTGEPSNRAARERYCDRASSCRTARHYNSACRYSDGRTTRSCSCRSACRRRGRHTSSSPSHTASCTDC